MQQDELIETVVEIHATPVAAEAEILAEVEPIEMVPEDLVDVTGEVEESKGEQPRGETPESELVSTVEPATIDAEPVCEGEESAPIIIADSSSAANTTKATTGISEEISFITQVVDVIPGKQSTAEDTRSKRKPEATKGEEASAEVPSGDTLKAGVSAPEGAEGEIIKTGETEAGSVEAESADAGATDAEVTGVEVTEIEKAEAKKNVTEEFPAEDPIIEVKSAVEKKRAVGIKPTTEAVDVMSATTV